MKTALAINSIAASADSDSRYHVYRQEQAGNYHREFSTDSAAEAVEAFLTAKPAFEGGALHLWDRREERSGASVHWAAVKTDFGFPVRRRSNVFYDMELRLIAEKVLERETLRQSLQHSVGMSV